MTATIDRPCDAALDEQTEGAAGSPDTSAPLDLIIEAVETVKVGALLLPLSCCEDTGYCESCSSCSSCTPIVQ